MQEKVGEVKVKRRDNNANNYIELEDLCCVSLVDDNFLVKRNKRVLVSFSNVLFV